jgi:cytochrome oxidase Cu insertion factor (SCO1/SenC/PrrC family)
MASEPPREIPPSQRFPESDDFPTGPEVGERLPDFTLRDQHGREVNFTQARAGRRALVSFQRSARW